MLGMPSTNLQCISPMDFNFPAPSVHVQTRLDWRMRSTGGAERLLNIDTGSAPKAHNSVQYCSCYTIPKCATADVVIHPYDQHNRCNPTAAFKPSTILPANV